MLHGWDISYKIAAHGIVVASHGWHNIIGSGNGLLQVGLFLIGQWVSTWIHECNLGSFIRTYYCVIGSSAQLNSVDFKARYDMYLNLCSYPWSPIVLCFPNLLEMGENLRNSSWATIAWTLQTHEFVYDIAMLSSSWNCIDKKCYFKSGSLEGYSGLALPPVIACGKARRNRKDERGYRMFCFVCLIFLATL